MTIKFNEIEDDVQQFKERRFIEPGIHDNVIILDVEEPENANYVTVKFGKNEQELYTKWYTTEIKKAEDKPSAMEVSLKKAKHLASAILTEEEKSAISGENTYALLRTILKKCVGKILRMKFIGEQFLRNDGTIGLQTKIGFSPFAEAMDTNPTRLKYNADNPYDYKRIPVVEIKASNDNPFK